jgi:hypothetical protein
VIKNPNQTLYFEDNYHYSEIKIDWYSYYRRLKSIGAVGLVVVGVLGSIPSGGWSLGFSVYRIG